MLLSRQNEDNRCSNVLLNKRFACWDQDCAPCWKASCWRDNQFYVTLQFYDAELAFFEEACIPLGCQKLSTSCRVFMFSYMLVTVLSCIANIILITQITHKRVNNSLLIYDWRFDFLGLRSCPNFLLINMGCSLVPILWLKTRTSLPEKSF